MTGVAQAYRYIRSSTLGSGLLGLQTSGGTALRRPVPNPVFFKGFLTEPAAAAASLHSVAKVAASRYFQPTLTRLRDPVVTCNGDRLRFESFASCCGVYARLDVLSAGLDGDVLDRGTTNVDVNEPLRRMLARVGSGDPLRLAVGPDDVTVSTVEGSVVEKKVKLPRRWIRGFAEVQVITARMEPRAELPTAEAARFLRSLPPSSRSRGALWVVPAGRSLRLSARPVPGAVCIAGPQRLEALTPLLRHAKSLRVYGPMVKHDSLPCASAWELTLPGMTFVLVTSPEVNRGFSGEGAVLDFLAGDQVADAAELIGGLLEFEPTVDPDLLAERSGLPRDEVRAALVQLGVSGRVGYDLAEAAYFHRELPYEADSVEQFNPRLRNARALAAAGAVTGDGDSLTVNGYQVRVAGGAASCTCAWWMDYRGTRGKCKHVLAAEIAKGI